jgi:hypothetical protein
MLAGAALPTFAALRASSTSASHGCLWGHVLVSGRATRPAVVGRGPRAHHARSRDGGEEAARVGPQATFDAAAGPGVSSRAR